MFAATYILLSIYQVYAATSVKNYSIFDENLCCGDYLRIAGGGELMGTGGEGSVLGEAAT